MDADETLPSERISDPSLAIAPVALGGRYTLVRRLGEGTSGAVFEVLDQASHERVALKMLKELDARSLYRFKREFRALVDVRHRNLVELYELGSDNERWFITMELVKGDNFVAWARRDPTPERLRELFVQLARGLNALHTRGLLHRDVKPSNVLVDESGRVVIVDFGIIAELGQRENARLEGEGISGTPAYMAPEQCAGEVLTPATDWYAVGTILFEVVTGRRPFAGGMAGMKERLLNPAPRMRDIALDAPADLDELCADLLSMDVAHRPSGDEILRRLGARMHISASAERPADARGLVGRAGEMAALDGALSDVRAGRSATVFVHGTSGMGKSALVEQFMRKAEQAGALVLPGRCYERESVPFKAFDGLMDVLVRHLVDQPEAHLADLLPPAMPLLEHLFPVLGSLPRARRSSSFGGDAQAQRSLAFEALRLLFERLAAREPLVVFIDDVQWGDDDSAQLLAALLAPPDEPRMLTVLGFRSEHAETSPILRRAREHAADVRTIALGPLAEVDARTLLRERLESDPPTSLASRVVAEAGGNPFFLEEFARYVRDTRARDHGSQSASPEPPPDLSLDRVLLARFEALDAAARRLLQAVALAGQPLDIAIAAAAGALGPEERAPAERTLRRAQFVRTAASGGATIEPFHDRIREAAALTLSVEQKREMHRRFVAALTDARVDDPDALYLHASGAGLAAEAADFAARAAARAFESFAFDRAASRYAQALELASDDDARAQAWRVARAEALAAGGHLGEAGEAYERAAERSGPADVIKLEGRATEQYLCGGYAERGTAAARRVLARVGIRLPSGPLWMLLSLALRVLWLRVRGISFTPRPVEEVPAAELTRIDVCYAMGVGFGRTVPLLGAELAIRGLLRALATGEPERVARSLGIVGIIVAMEGGSARKWGDLLQETAAAMVPSRTYLAAVSLSARLTSNIMHGEWGVAVERGWEALDIFRQHPVSGWERRLAILGICSGLTHSGRLNEARTHGAALLREARESSDLYIVAIAATVWGYLLDLANDAPAAAHEAIEATSKSIPDKPVQLYHGYAAVAHAQADVYEGDVARAAARLEAGVALLRPAMLMRVRFVRVHFAALGARIALAELRAGRGIARNRRAVEAHVRSLLRDGAAWPVGHAELARGGLAAIDRGPAAAIEPWERALAAFEAAGMALHAAATRYRIGASLGGDKGNALVSDAVEWMREQRIADPAKMAALIVDEVNAQADP